jgi:hypothetical protein
MRYIFVKINIIIYLQVVELIPFLQHSPPNTLSLNTPWYNTGYCTRTCWKFGERAGILERVMGEKSIPGSKKEPSMEC